MNEKNDNPGLNEPNPDPSLPDPAEDTASSSDQENGDAGSATEESPPSESLEAKPAWPEPSPAPKKSFPFTPLLLILTLGAAGGGGFWIFEEQKKLHKEVQAGFNRMVSRLDTVEADLQRLQNNQQQLEASNRTFQAYQAEVAETFKAHQNSMSTLDEDIIRIKDELDHLAETVQAVPATVVTPPPAEIEPGKESGETVVEEPGDSSAEIEAEQEPVVLAEEQATDPVPAPTEAELKELERNQEAQEYIDFVESTTGKFFRLVKEGFSKMWQWFASLFG